MSIDAWDELAADDFVDPSDGDASVVKVTKMSGRIWSLETIIPKEIRNERGRWRFTCEFWPYDS